MFVILACGDGFEPKFDESKTTCSNAAGMLLLQTCADGVEETYCSGMSKDECEAGCAANSACVYYFNNISGYCTHHAICSNHRSPTVRGITCMKTCTEPIGNNEAVRSNIF